MASAFCSRFDTSNTTGVAGVVPNHALVRNQKYCWPRDNSTLLWCSSHGILGAGRNSPISTAPTREVATSVIAVSRATDSLAKQAGAKVVYIEVPGGSHTDVVVPQFGPMLEFFAAQAKPRLSLDIQTVPDYDRSCESAACASCL